MIEALDLDKAEKTQGIDDQSQLQQGLLLLNQQKWQQANELLIKNIKDLEKQLSFATLFQRFYGFFLSSQSEQSNKSLYKLLLIFFAQSLVIIPFAGYALNDDSKFNLAVEQCDKVLNADPQNLHALYRKGLSLINWKEYEQAISCIEKALKSNPNYSICYFIKGNSLHNLNKYEDAISCYDKAIQIDPNYAQAYINKGISLRILNKHQLAIANYELAIKYCKTDEDEFKRRIQEIKNQK
ncbi:unnamed protein product [Paramecium primaurelia]|uniref:Tetratricopeptide repeat protein n=1 Tax=Paramecium primaurelia TaxID=5886 RepID=A0A8S1QUK1_PARPR|nr:unnamed protein product [Paramecium primaurelia]